MVTQTRTNHSTVRKNRKAARQAYIQFALDKIVVFFDFATAPSEEHRGDAYIVQIKDGNATSCECSDNRYRKHSCKHMEAVQARLDASVPLFGTNEMTSLLTDLEEALKPPMPVLPEGFRIRKKRGVNKLEVVRVATIIEMPVKTEFPQAA